MPKETLRTWPEKQEKLWLKSKVKEIFWTLWKSMEQRKMDINESNRIILDGFRQGACTSLYYEEWQEYIMPLEWRDFRNMRIWDTILFNSLKELTHKKVEYLESFVDYIDEYPAALTDYVTLKIGDDVSPNDTEYLKYLFNKFNISFRHVKIEFPSRLFCSGPDKWKSRLKMLKNFIKKDICTNCYFDIWDNIYHWQNNSDKNNYLKDLITWFTKQWKAWKVINCVIKANGKEYHSSWDYRYENFD